MKAYYSDQFVLPLPHGHRFPISKYSLLRQRIVDEGLIDTLDLLIPDAATDQQLLLVHTAEYVEKVKLGLLTEKEIRRIGFPWSAELVERSRRSVGGTIAACHTAVKERISANLAGGTHHAYASHGEGFCVFNDVAVAARVIQAEKLANKIVILDCDVHQGNGTAAIFKNDPTVFTFSIHGKKNFPFHKEISDIDISLEDDTGDELFLEKVLFGVRESLKRARADLAVYLAGADPYRGDRLGRLAISKAGLLERDRIVLESCRETGTPVAITMSGGYGKVIEDTVDIHFQTIQLAAKYNMGDGHDHL